MATGGGIICVDGGSLSRWQARSPLRAAPTPQKSPKATRAIPGLQDQRAIRALPGTTLRVVAPQSSTASCQTDEIMISAYCTGTFTNYPLVPLTNGARCGANPNSTTLRVTIVCAKR